ncbi:TonB-dependent receptor [Parapedobacter sp.]|uniref:SusC/RagA family TonB-linked outer membrane protein n=1 Tax=Parapedobacter sp. TaxID=1958893 RepID=UPI002D80DE0B|nr:TonB-dependent receptor [Parapedobacter sp.]
MRIIGILFLLLLHGVSMAQTKRVSGVVKDAGDGTPLAGVSLTVQGKAIATQTDANGEFSLEAAVGDTLVFSFVGKLPAHEAVGDRNVLEIMLYDDESQLDEVTVVAFGTQKKTSVVGSITTVKASDLRVPSSNLTSSFAGRIPGMVSFQTTGEPGADNAQFFIRGVTTFGYQTSPLILIDGFEATTDALARLRPDDIESFSILKDASATVLYGARGANGIIMITTKSGREGPVQVNARVDFNVSSPVQMTKLLDGVEYMQLYNEARITRDPLLGAYYSQQKIQSTIDGVSPMLFPNVDWHETLFNKSTNNAKANVNLSGGGQVANYYVSAGWEKETGLLKVDNRNNFNNNIDINRAFIRSNVIFKLTPTTTLDTRIQGQFERYNGPWASATDIFYEIMWSNPVDFPAVYEPDAANEFANHTLFGNTWVGGGMKPNPYASMVRGYNDRNESRLTTQATLMQDFDFITEGLKFQGRISANIWSQYQSLRTYSPFFYSLQDYNQVTGDYTLYSLNPNAGSVFLGNVEPGRNADGHYYFEGRLNWDRVFGKHTVGLMTVGMMEEKLLTAGNSTSIYETLPERNMGNSGRATYDFDNRYFFEFAYGFNGSEKFDGSKRYGFFPSVGGGWMVSNEKFFEPATDIFSTLKLRATWGLVGNDAIAERKDRFFYLSDIGLQGGTNTTANGYRWGTNFMNAYSGYYINRYANADITWEVSEKYNLGLEVGLFNEALKIEGDFFRDIRSNIYMVRQNFPSTAGLEASISGNVGKALSQGFDGSITYQHFFNNEFWLNGRANFTYATNEYLELDERDYADRYLSRLGHNINQQWGLVAERLFVDEAEIANSPRQDFGEYMAGDIKYKDVNGDGVINGNDEVPLGFPTVPEIQYGFGLSAGYKRFDFSFFFQGNDRVSFFINPGVGGGNDNDEGIAPFVLRRNALEVVARDYWTETNPNVHAFWPRLSTEPIDNNLRQSSWWLRDASFLRLKSVELGYSPKGLKRIGLGEGTRIYVSSENPLVFSSFKLWDPEMGRRGLRYPPNKRFNIGIQLSL